MAPPCESDASVHSIFAPPHDRGYCARVKPVSRAPHAADGLVLMAQLIVVLSERLSRRPDLAPVGMTLLEGSGLATAAMAAAQSGSRRSVSS